MRSFLMRLAARDELGRVGGRCAFQDLSAGEAAALPNCRERMRRGQESPGDKS